jgi:hypothetical protein
MMLKSTIKYLACIYLLSILVISCSSNISARKKGNFNTFLDSIPKLRLPVTLYDSVILNYNHWGKQFDTNEVMRFHLLKGYIDTNSPNSKLIYYQCAPVGYFTIGNAICLIYKTSISNAGDGNPEVILSIFNKNGERLYGEPILIQAYDQVGGMLYPYKGKIANQVTITDSLHFITTYSSALWSSDTVPILQSLIKSYLSYLITPQDSINELSRRDTTIFRIDKGVKYPLKY